MNQFLHNTSSGIARAALIALFLLLAGCATTPSPIADLHEAASRSNQEGLALIERDAFAPARERFSEAIARLEQALGACETRGACTAEELEVVRHNLALAYTNRAYTLMHMGEMDAEALDDAERALDLAPDLVQPHQYRAIIAVRSLNEEAAWSEYRFLRERDPDFAEKLYEAYEEAFGPRLPESGTGQ